MGKPTTPRPPKSVPVAIDDRGTLIIVRQVFEDLNVSQTIVWNDDGTHWAFGEQTVASLLSCSPVDSSGWVNSLTTRQIHALVYEIGHRLVERAARYQALQSERAEVKVQDSYKYFGLEEATSDKELDNAYRRLARAMHPDKNGGTEEAKEAFQAMKERYEALKAHRAGKDPSKQQEAVEEEQPQTNGHQDDTTVTYDPGSRDSMLQAVWDIVRRLQVLQRGMDGISQQAGMGGA